LLKKYIHIVKEYVYNNYSNLFRESGGNFDYPFIVPGSQMYSDVLWDWDSWLTNIALKQIAVDLSSEDISSKIKDYEYGCILNALNWCTEDGWIPIALSRTCNLKDAKPKDVANENMHKPVLAQHAAFLIKYNNDDAEWIRDKFDALERFINNYLTNHRHEKSGLFYFQTDMGIGVDNDPSTFFRPNKSSGSVYLNIMMYEELKSMAYISKCLGYSHRESFYNDEANKLRNIIIASCYDERDGFYYSVDLNLLPNDHLTGFLHTGCPREWEFLIQRLSVWSGFMAMWSEVATKEQAERMVKEHFYNENTFMSDYGIRSLGKTEKMYSVKPTSNPSNWLGGIWGIANYMVFVGLINYGYTKEAKELAEKLIFLFGKDIEKTGEMHEYYNPETGEGVMNEGFLSWNLLIINIIAWLENREVIK